jgi:hypothetical protein
VYELPKREYIHVNDGEWRMPVSESGECWLVSGEWRLESAKPRTPVDVPL